MTEPTNADIFTVLGEMKADLKTVVARGADHEKRIRDVERRVTWAAGVASFLGLSGIAAAFGIKLNGS
jgi:hypothetical protein